MAQPHVRLLARRAPPPALGPAAGAPAPALPAPQEVQPGVGAGAPLEGQPGEQAAQHAQQAQQRQEEEDEEGDDELVPDPLRCVWVRDAAQRRLLPRLRANTKMMGMLVFITAGGHR